MELVSRGTDRPSFRELDQDHVRRRPAATRIGPLPQHLADGRARREPKVREHVADDRRAGPRAIDAAAEREVAEAAWDRDAEFPGLRGRSERMRSASTKRVAR